MCCQFSIVWHNFCDFGLFFYDNGFAKIRDNCPQFY